MMIGTSASAALIALLGFTAGGCTRAQPSAGSDARPPHAAPPGEAQAKAVRIPVEGMSCSSCVARVKRELSGLGGVSSVHVDLASRSAVVRFVPGRVSEEAIVAKINELGYRAGPATDARE